MIVSFNNTKKRIEGSVNLPASKSLSNRALVIQFLTKRNIQLSNLSEAQDTVLMNQLLNEIQSSSNTEILLDCKDAGTVFRFLTAVCAIQDAKIFKLTGTERMQQRPIQDLVNAMQVLHASITYIGNTAFPPLRILGTKLDGGEVKISGSASSQFISALCLIAPQLKHGLTIEIQEHLVSLPYVHMTLGLMKIFGVSSNFIKNKITIKPQSYRPTNYHIENDWSSASFLFAIALLKSSYIELPGLSTVSLQGDSEIVQISNYFGVQTGETQGKIIINSTDNLIYNGPAILDLSNYPDLALPLIVSCALRWPDLKFTGIQHLEYKESKRLSALSSQLKKIGIELKMNEGILSISKNKNTIHSAEYVEMETYDDHRLAMSFALISLMGYRVKLSNSICVKKSFPNYWQELTKLGFEIKQSIRI